MPRLHPETRRCIARLAATIAARQRGGARIIGIQGPQGAGKTTLARCAAALLERQHGLTALCVSLDDFYLGRAERRRLAERVHPLLITRGVPGTHAVDRGIDALARLRAGQPCRLPQFSKADDEPLPHEREIRAAVDVVLFEGWCVGVPPQDAAELTEPVNELEREQDPDGHWRAWVNARLAGPYAEWFTALDALLHLQTPGWESIRAWRAQQERETARRHGAPTALAEPAALQHFLAHYQRLTEHAARRMPAIADWTIALDTAHRAHWAAGNGA